MTDSPLQNLPRFLPTLTEVVNQSDLTEAPVLMRSDVEEIVQSVMQQIRGPIETRLVQEIDALVRSQVEEQLQRLRLHLGQELELDVRQAVVDAIARRSRDQK